MSISKKSLESHQRSFGKNVKKHRERNEFTQVQLAVLCDFEKTTISRIENGRSNVTLKTMLILAEALDIDVEELISFESGHKIY